MIGTLLTIAVLGYYVNRCLGGTTNAGTCGV
jgi:hypothetical protein